MKTQGYQRKRRAGASWGKGEKGRGSTALRRLANQLALERKKTGLAQHFGEMPHLKERGKKCVLHFCPNLQGGKEEK